MSGTVTGRALLRLPVDGLVTSRLFCFPHAGGGVAAFASWRTGLPPGTELCVSRRPGRESRLAETPWREPGDAVEEALASIRPLVADGLPYLLYGHSVGAVIAYEAGLRLADEGPAPACLGVGAAAAPPCWSHQVVDEPPPADDRAGLVDMLRRYGGTDPALLEDDEVVALLSVPFRADIALAARYHPALPPLPQPGPVVAFSGRDDPFVDPADAARWRECAGAGFEHVALDGGHFFLAEHGASMVARMRAAAGL